MLAIAAPSASAATACAQTTDPATPAAPSPGTPCWVDVTPYPFGADGLPVDTSSLNCPGKTPPQDGFGYQSLCYLRVTSMAFRAYNRGLAATSNFEFNGPMTISPFGVWLFNGSRWYPDPTFPGPSVCGGDTVLWAGKLDYWLVGKSTSPGHGGSSLCRYDGSTFAWQPLEIPNETRAKVLPPLNPASVTAGSCFAWNDCWFFGPEGVRLHWDGAGLADFTPAVDTPWLRSRATAATARVGGDGRKTGVAVTWTSGFDSGFGGTAVGQQVPVHDGALPAQAWHSDGGAFTPFPFIPPTVPAPDDPSRTDLVAVDLDPLGRGWIAGNPVGRDGALGGRVPSGVVPAPVLPFALGDRPPCKAPLRTFEFDRSVTNASNGHDAYLWQALSIFPQSGDALAGGWLRPATPGTAIHDDGHPEPVLTRVGCDGSVTDTRFRESDPTPGNGSVIAPANYRGRVEAVAANAANDAWAMISSGSSNGGGIPVPKPSGSPDFFWQRPHLYRLTDTAKPAATAGDDVEDRPFEVVQDPPIFVEDVPPPEPPPAPDEPPVVTHAPTKTKRVRQKPSIYSPKVSKPKRIKGDRFVMVITFRVRRPVTVGVQALRKNTVVSRSGLKRFKGKRGTLKLEITRKRWPTRIRFYQRSGSTR
ncbi:MAG TPA: hypothetical protein VI300_13880 [Solirubrobacter sp.]